MWATLVLFASSCLAFQLKEISANDSPTAGCTAQPKDPAKPCEQLYICPDGRWVVEFLQHKCQKADQAKCGLPLKKSANKCCDICPCVDHKGKHYSDGQKFMFGQTNPNVKQCTCKNKHAECVPVFIIPPAVNRPPPTFPPFPWP